MSKLLTPKFLLLLLSLALLISVIGARVASAQSSSSSGTFTPSQEKKIENFSYLNVKYTAKGLSNLIWGDPGKKEAGAIGGIIGLIGGVYQYHPASGVGYLADIGRNLGLVKPALAQACTDTQGDCEGFEALSPVQDLWVISRNLVYLIYIIVFMIIGLMIVLRTRIDPRTVSTVQSAVPGVIISLLLVTFSYALAGLVIDVMRLANGLIAQIFTQAGFTDQLQGIITRIQGGDLDIFDIVSALFEGAQESVLAVIQTLFSELSPLFPAGEIVGFVISNDPGETILKIIVGLLVGILIIMITFRTFIMLLLAFVNIILLTIFGPFLFLYAALPGRGSVVLVWFRAIFVAALTFPATFLLLAMAAMFMSAPATPWDIWGGTSPIGPINFIPVPLGKIADGTEFAALMSDLIGIGILVLIPRVNELISGALPAAQVGHAIGAELRGPMNVFGRGLPI